MSGGGAYNVIICAPPPNGGQERLVARYGILILEDGDNSDPRIPDGFIALSRYSSGRPCVTAFS